MSCGICVRRKSSKMHLSEHTLLPWRWEQKGIVSAQRHPGKHNSGEDSGDTNGPREAHRTCWVEVPRCRVWDISSWLESHWWGVAGVDGWMAEWIAGWSHVALDVFVSLENTIIMPSSNGLSNSIIRAYTLLYWVECTLSVTDHYYCICAIFCG